jgi:hypothetical protein
LVPSCLGRPGPGPGPGGLPEHFPHPGRPGQLGLGGESGSIAVGQRARAGSDSRTRVRQGPPAFKALAGSESGSCPGRRAGVPVVVVVDGPWRAAPSALARARGRHMPSAHCKRDRGELGDSEIQIQIQAAAATRILKRNSPAPQALPMDHRGPGPRARHSAPPSGVFSASKLEFRSLRQTAFFPVLPAYL